MVLLSPRSRPRIDLVKKELTDSSTFVLTLVSIGQECMALVYYRGLFWRILKSFLLRLLRPDICGDGSGGQGAEPPDR